MTRRTFLATLAAVPLAAGASPPAVITAVDWGVSPACSHLYFLAGRRAGKTLLQADAFETWLRWTTTIHVDSPTRMAVLTAID